jgi:beta-barrel assembly-enhancing protease
VKRALALTLALLLALPASLFADGGERELGRRFYLEARSQLPLVEDPALTEYVNRLGHKLVDSLGPQAFDYQFFVVAHPALNAFAVPGGYIFIFTGLLARTKTDDELVGVLGHEISHVHAHHISRQQTAGQFWSAAALAGLLLAAVNPVLGAAGLAAAQTAQLKFSRDFEQEADFLGLRIASESGYDPHALGAFFKQLLVEQQLNPAGVPPYMLSHPVTQDRVAHVDSVIKAQKLKTPSGRPSASGDLAEVRAVSDAINEPPGVVTERYERLAREKPNDAERQFLLGRVYQTVGKMDSARVALEKARALGMGWQVDRPLGSVYIAMKRPKEGAEALTRFLTKRPDDAFAHLELAKALGESGDQEKAFTELQRAVRLNPDLDEAQRMLGLALGRKGNEGQGFYHLALAARQRGDLEKAYDNFERAEPLLEKGSRQQAEVQSAMDELVPLVRDRMRLRGERRRVAR